MSKAVHGFNLYHLSTRRRVWPAQTVRRQPCKKCLKCGSGIFCHLHQSGPVLYTHDEIQKAWDTYSTNPDLQEQWMAVAARKNALAFTIPGIFRQPDGLKAWVSPFGAPLLRHEEILFPAYRCGALRDHTATWTSMTRKEQDEWYLKEKEPLMLAMTAQRVSMLKCLCSEGFKALPDGVLEIIAFHMANEAWVGLVLFREGKE